MELSMHRKILAEMYGCGENEILGKFEKMMPQIRNEAILTLSIPRTVKTNVDADAPTVYA